MLTCSEIGAATFPLPIVEPSWLKSLDLEAVFLADIIVLVRESGKKVHDVSFVWGLSFLREFLPFVVRLLLDHSLGVYGFEDLLLRELLWLKVLTQGGLLVLDTDCLVCLVKLSHAERENIASINHHDLLSA